MKRISLIFAALLTVLPFRAGAQSVMDLIKENPQRAAANLYHYEIPQPIIDTPAPEGYEPFYVSHYGRHGSRYQNGTYDFTRVNPVFDELAAAGLLTETGKMLAADLKTLGDEHEKMDGVLTLRGGQEHQGIAQRLYDRYPEMFNNPDRNRVFSISTPVHRVIQSLANFTSQLKGNNPDLNLIILVGDRFGDLLCYDKYSRPRSNTTEITDSLRTVYIHPERFMSVMFTDTKKAEEIISRPPKVDESTQSALPAGFRMPAMNAATFMQAVYSAGSISNCLDQNNPDIMRYFNAEELYGLWYLANAGQLNNYGFTVENQCGRKLTAQITVTDIIEKADDAVAGNNRCADLRFGHDTGLGPLLSLLAVDGYDKVLSLANDSMEEWPAFKYLNMGSNLQMIFFKNDAGDVLVKLYRNENETFIPALKTYYGPYYKWSDLRAYLVSLLDGFVNPLV